MIRKKVRTMIIAATLMMFMCGIAGSAAAKTVNVNEKNNKGCISIGVGDTIQISLKGNPTTGYDWTGDVKSPLKLIKRDFKADTHMTGSGGTATFTVKAVKTGKSKMVFAYKRSWEKVAPLQTFELNINVASGK